MAGNNSAPRVQKPYSISCMFDSPLDDRLTISSLANLSTELPIDTRYQGLFVFVTDIKSYYCFKDGIEDSDFILFGSQTNLEYTEIVSLNGNTSITHSLGSTDIVLRAFENINSLVECKVDWIIGETDYTGKTSDEIESIKKNVVTLQTDLTNLSIVIKINKY
jgi:hypothetical protein